MSDPAAEAGLRLSRAQRRRAAAQNVAEDAPREGVAVFRPVDKAVLVALEPSAHAAAEVEASLDELELLVDTAGSKTVGRVVQRRERPDSATFIGRGKVAELKALCAQLDADAVIFDDELTPAQQRNLEERLGVKVLDRTIVILDIFGQHATSREGKTQVELAQLTYLLPRLRGWGEALSQQAGGIGTLTRGPGETQMELDRRKLNRRITKLKRDLVDYERTRQVRTKRRERQGAPTVALVGYTNAGKSTLLNAMTGADVLVADQLFATLDPTARRLALPDGRTAIATDTVGFVRKLPTQLVEAFKSTLEETLRADLLVHVVDAAHEEALAQVAAVDDVLRDIGAGAVPRLVVLNKNDLASPERIQALQRALPDAVVVSAVTGDGIERLVQRIAGMLPPYRRVVEALVPYARTDVVARVYREGEVFKREERDDGIWLQANIGPATFDALRDYALTDPWSDA